MKQRRRDPGPRRGHGKAPAARHGGHHGDERAGRSGPGRGRPKPARRRAIRVTPEAAPAPATDGKIRLNRYLASAGVCSRRAADELIQTGHVTVNGTAVTELGVRVTPGADTVRVDGVKVEPERKVYVLFNKPKGVLCTTAGDEPRKRVIDYLPHVRGRIYTVGRLDAESEGLILLTNDGEFALRMMHPRYGMPKTYAVTVKGTIDQAALGKARGGVWLAEGRTGGMEIRIDSRERERTRLRVTLREGRNRELRRVFARLGHDVVALKRIRIGELTLHGLQPGESRFLAQHEVRGLLELAQSTAAPVQEDGG